MISIQLMTCIGMTAGFFMLFGISPMAFTGSVFESLTDKPKSLKDEINETTQRKKPSYLRREIMEVQAILTVTGRENQFPMICAASLLLFAVGASAAILIGNFFLVPVMAAGFLFLPFWWVKLTANHFKKDIAGELETALSIITTAYRLGKMYAAGLGIEQDYELAAYWLNLSADEGYKYAQYSLGGLYYHGKGVEQDYQQAFSLYTRSAEQGFPYASFERGKTLRDGIGCIKNNTIAEVCFREAFQGFFELEKSSHDDKLQYRLGWMLLNGIGTEKDIPKAWKYLESAASVGNPFACYQFAKLVLSEEIPEPEQVEKALDFLNQSVEAGNSSAQYFLGKLYEKGQHVPENAAEAVRLYTLAVEQGNDFAAYRLGKLYLGGDGILKDVELVLHWLNFAAEKGNSFAEYALGVLYLKGEDVSKDIHKAVDFLNRAAEKENEFARYRLGKIYLAGEELPKDVGKALQYLTAAAEQGNQYAQYTLGKICLMGKDIPRDKEAAVKWFTLSAEQGNIYAQFFLDHMDQWREPSVLLAATRLLHHMSRVFADNIPPMRTTGQNTDRKLLQKLREKKQAQGHARDEHGQVM